MANAGMLTLGVGRVDADIQEAGGWVSLRQGIAGHVVGDPDRRRRSRAQHRGPAPGLQPPGADASTPGTWSGGGVNYNLHERVGIEASPAQGLTFFTEVFSFQTGLVRGRGRSRRLG